MITTGIVMIQHKVDSILIFPAGTASLSAISANCAIDEAVGAAAANSEISNTLFVWGNLNVIPVRRTQKIMIIGRMIRRRIVTSHIFLP